MRSRKRASLDLARLVGLDDPSSGLSSLRQELRGRDAAWFNDPKNFKGAIRQILDARDSGGGGGGGESAPPLVASNSEATAEAALIMVQTAVDWTAESWLDSVGVAKLVAPVLLADSPDQLESVVTLSSAQVSERMAGLSSCLATALLPQLRKLASLGAATSAELHSKFLQEPTAFSLQFQDVATFYGGLEAAIGAPDPRVREAMEREHTASADSADAFVADGRPTKPEVEWAFVVLPDEPTPIERTPLPMTEVMRLLTAKNAELEAMRADQLLLEEVLAARL